jgi:hypothetical protein
MLAVARQVVMPGVFRSYVVPDAPDVVRRDVLESVMADATQFSAALDSQKHGVPHTDEERRVFRSNYSSQPS